MSGKAETKNSVLTENTAQGVFKYLNDIESNRARMHTRWIWELLQNARDASSGPNAHIAADIEYQDGNLTFLHNGRGFEEREIAHLIFHGSTKVEDDNAIGKFGSGFLTTHLLSPAIDISGKLDDGLWFDFRLERKPSSVLALRESMDRAWDDFNPSSSLPTATMLGGFTARFVYPIDEDAVNSVKEGIQKLTRYAPLVVAFNQEFSSINVNDHGKITNFEVMERTSLEQDGLQKITVAESANGDQKERIYLLAKDGNTAVAFPLASVGDGSECLQIDNTPRLFLGFPLVGTETFSFPAIINGSRFAPTENRDGVYLGQASNKVNRQNQEIVQKACELLVKMIRFSVLSGYRNVYLLADVPAIQDQNWLSTDWLRKCLKETLIERFRKSRIVLNESGETILPEALELPIAKTVDGVNTLWNLLVEWRQEDDVWPKQNEATGWSNAITSWADILSCELSSFNEVVDGRRLASRVDNVSHDASSNAGTHRLSLLNSSLKNGVSGIDWLERLNSFLRENELGEVASEYRIIPSQGEFLRTLPKLHRDNGIHNALKDIAVLLDWHIKCELRDTCITSLDDEAGAGEWNCNYVVGELINKIRIRAVNNPDDNFGKGSVSLFAWIVHHGLWDSLQDFPAFAEKDEVENKRRVLKLSSTAKDSKTPLSPVPTWEEDLQPFSEIFPGECTLAKAFFDVAPEPEIWQTLDEQDFLRRDVVIAEKKRLSAFLPDEPMSDEEHETVDAVAVTNIAFITQDKFGIMPRVRSSQRLARVF